MMLNRNLLAVARSAFAGLIAAVAGMSSIVQAQSSPSPYSYATRYDAQRRVVGTIAPDPDGNGPLHYQAVRNTFDPAGRLIRVEKGELAAWVPDSVLPKDWSSYTTFTVQSSVDTDYDAMDRKTQERTSSGGKVAAVTQFSYDSFGRLECTAVRMNPTVFGSLPASACALGTQGSQGPDRITRNTYDAAGQLLKVQNAYGTGLQQDHVTYTYTVSGKHETITDANGNRARLVYDGFDRQIVWAFPSKANGGTTAACTIGTVAEVNGVTGPSETYASGDDCEKYAYDRSGNRAKVMRRDGRVLTFGYDSLNRMISKVVPDGCAPLRFGACPAPAATRDVYYGYDLRGLQTYARFDSASGPGVMNEFDGFGRLASSTTTLAGVSRTLNYMNDADGNRIRITHPDGVYFDMAFDGLDRMVGASWWAPSTGTMSILTIAFRSDGLRRYTKRGLSQTNYGYDGVGRLTAEGQNFAGGTGNVAVRLSYNPAGQIATQGRDNDDYAFTGYVAVNRSYQVNGLNQYTAAGSTTFGYDANGNLIKSGTTTYGYDAENRLVSTSTGTSLAYDPLGRLWRSGGGVWGTSQFLYDGDALVAEYDADTGALRRRFMHGPGDDEPILWGEGQTLACAGARFLHADHQGSIVATADCGGNRTAVNAYDEFGIPKPGSDPLTGTGNVGRFQYTGQLWLPELGMYHYKARLYSPTLGRFLQTDPIGYDDQINLYAYVANDPVNGRDPTGMAGDDSDWKKRVVDVVIGTAKVATGAVLTAAGVAGIGASGVGEVGTAGAATPLAVPAAIASTAVAATGIAMAADGAAQFSGAIMRSTPAGSNGGDSNGGGNSGNGNLSGHAQDRMGQRGVSPDRVQEAQQIGRVKPGNSPDTVVREVPSAASESGRGVRIVMDRATGRVITVIDKGSKFK